eukprot:CAMPEP_0169412596 /NCGR_PEP_ID=MMETSP1017-20121227/60903_1 /TAXON_ID=342587 /ORGANISM="Karlodinium micrum, Strain CCMP2283" /LENGTH=51 /DNA_ID=CAMNT_0009519947 /DNA_START=322 /DNA_END=477 /DNA_ORIENTATION=+
MTYPTSPCKPLGKFPATPYALDSTSGFNKPSSSEDVDVPGLPEDIVRVADA